jgi:hypothetical protein
MEEESARETVEALEVGGEGKMINERTQAPSIQAVASFLNIRVHYGALLQLEDDVEWHEMKSELSS